MKFNLCILVAVAAVSAEAALTGLSPANDEKVQLLPEAQRKVLALPTLEERIALFRWDRKENGKKIRHDPLWRKSNPLVLKWKATDGETGLWEIKIAKSSDFSDARTWFHSQKKADAATGRTSGGEKSSGDAQEYVFTVPRANLEIGTRYYWKVTSDVTCGRFAHARKCACKNRKPSVESEVASFVTADFAPRWIEIEGDVGNFRDLGGRLGRGGKRVRQGLVYRGQGLNNNSPDGAAKGRNRLTVEDVEYLTGTLGIRTDLDLRTPCETAGLDGKSPLGPSVKFIHHSSACYEGIFTPSGKKTMAKNFRVFCDRANYPIYFHCIGGADRTGALGYVLNGVLGVDRRELETDWESTFYPNIPDENPDPKYWCRESHFNDGFGKYGSADMTWNDRIVLYLKDCGITDEEIEAFRTIMLDR